LALDAFSSPPARVIADNNGNRMAAQNPGDFEGFEIGRMLATRLAATV
jgi:hypothetical protein